jgi:hypothetical protein
MDAGIAAEAHAVLADSVILLPIQLHLKQSHSEGRHTPLHECVHHAASLHSEPHQPTGADVTPLCCFYMR